MQLPRQQNSDYLFLVGKVRVYETTLFDRGYFHRLINSGSRNRFIKELSDTKYRSAAEDMASDGSDNFIIACNVYLYDIYRQFKNNVGDSAFMDIFMMEADIADFVNFSRGAECKESYCRGVLNINWSEAENLTGFFKEARNKLEKIKPSAALEDIEYLLIEKVCMDMVTDIYLKKVQSPALKEYRRFYIDTKNLLLKANMPDRANYFKGGNIEPHFWKNVDISEEITGEIPGKLQAQPYMERLKTVNDRNLWEPELRRFLSKLLKDMRKNTFGPEAVVAYILSVKEEIKNLNLIYTGLGMGLDKNIMKENLNLAYV